MSQPNLNEILEDEARTLALELELPLITLPRIFSALSTAFFLGYDQGAKQVLHSVDKHLGICRHD